MDFNICWSIDCESVRKDVNDTELGKRALSGFCSILDEEGFSGTLFLMPEETVPLYEVVAKAVAKGHEAALHLHPDESGHRSGCMGVYSYEEQMEIIGEAVRKFERVLGIKPVSARPGFGSANDATFRALADSGFRQTSASFPGRMLTSAVSNWAGAPLFAHYANPHNRFLEGGLDLVEIPISVDRESMIWGGVHPQDLRVELTDAKNHSFGIAKIMRQQISLAFLALAPFTHNIFDYSDPGNFRAQTMRGMNESIKSNAQMLGFSPRGTTFAQAADDFRTIQGGEKSGN